MPDHQHDPWSRIQSIHGFAADELISTLQKSIRRGMVENAAITAYEMYLSSAPMEDQAWRRLETISVEDVGMGNPHAPLLIHALNDFRQRVPRDVGDRFLFLLHAVRVLALSQKDRTSDEMVNWIRRVVDRGEAQPELFDDVFDMHTRRGQQMGRGFEQWFNNGARVENELPGRDTTYRQRLLDAIEQDRAEP